MAYLGRKGASAALTSADIPNDSITSAKIPDDALDSEHYTDGSIDSAHIGDDQVTGAKIENNPTIAGNLTVAGDLVPATPLSHRNMIINGAMNVHQRGTTASHSALNVYAVDRWRAQHNGLDQLNYTCVKSSTNAPTDKGFSNSMLYTTTTAESAVDADEYVRLRYVIEAQDLLPLQAGSASAKSFTISFWVRSSLTGTWAGNISASDGGKNIGFTYTISSADTWEKKEITLAGNTSDTPTYDNTAGYYIWLYLGAGSNHTGTSNTTWATETDARTAYGNSNALLTTLNATWQITGIQFELGSNATPFEFRSYGDELQRCLRYYEKEIKLSGAGGSGLTVVGRDDGSGDGAHRGHIAWKVQKRGMPTVAITAYGSSIYWSGSSRTVASVSASEVSDHNFRPTLTCSSFIADVAYANNLEWTCDAEL